MIKRITVVAALVASCAAASLPAEAAGIYVNVAPPVAPVEVVPAARPGYVWTPGYYNYRGGRYVWSRGVFVRERPGYRWHPHGWVSEGGRYHYDRGHWER